MQFPMPHYDAFAPHAPAVLLARQGPSCWSPLEQETHQFTSMTY